MKFLAKILFLLVFCSFFNHHGLAQKWARKGDVWIYWQYTFPFQDDAFHRIESQGDTLIRGTICKKLQWMRITQYDTSYQEMYTYESNDSVYFLDHNMDSFRLAYRFNAAVGDTIEGRFSYGYLKYRVDSIGEFELLDGSKRRTQYVSNSLDPGVPFYVRNPIIEGIGNIEWIQPNSELADPPTGGSLSCYYSGGQRLYGYSPGCDVLSSTKDTKLRIEIFPNPTFGTVELKTDGELEEVNIIGMDGMIYPVNDFYRFSLPNASGIYLIRIGFRGKYFYSKVVKLK